MNLNSLRFEGFWGTSREIYDLCDENGILLMVGWSCQWEWPDYLGLEMEVPEEDENIPINEGVDKYGVKITPEKNNCYRICSGISCCGCVTTPLFCLGGGQRCHAKPHWKRNTPRQWRGMTKAVRYWSCGDFTSELSGVTG
jgi:exo-1,4-beta-D-glucosaminidase